MATIKVTVEIYNATASTIRSITNGIMREALETAFTSNNEEIGEIDVIEGVDEALNEEEII